MRNVPLVRMVAGLFVFGCALLLCQGCGSTPGAVGGGVSGNGGHSAINLGLGGQYHGFGGQYQGLGGQYQGLGGQTGTRARGTGGMVVDAASADVPAARKDARLEGTASDVPGPASTDGPQAPDRAAMLPDVRLAADHAATPDPSAKEAGVRGTPPVIDAGATLDLGAPDEPPSRIDGSETKGLDAVATGECSYGGTTYAVGDSFPNDCNTCFCVASGEVVCTVKVCPIDGGDRRQEHASLRTQDLQARERARAT